MADSAAVSIRSGPPGQLSKRNLLQLVATAGTAVGNGVFLDNSKIKIG
jgi:hypothetical protein